MFLNCSTCFERHTTHHEELKNCNCALWFYIRLWLSHDSCRQSQTYEQPEGAITVFELLMMSGVSLETCWAIKKYWNNKFYYTFASCWLFLCDLYCDAPFHEHQVHRKNSHFHASSGARTDDTNQSYIPKYARDKIIHKCVPSYVFQW